MGNPVATKPDLTQGRPQAKNNIFVALLHKFFNWGQVEAQSPSNGVEVRFDPILRYIEGCAYDSSKRKLPTGTTVGVYPTFSNSPYYTTNTDANGCFRITSDYLPSFSYVLKYKTPSGLVIKETTTSFLDKNKEYIADKNIDVNKYIDSAGNTTSPERKAALEQKGTTQGNGAANGGTFMGDKTNSSSFMIGLIIVLLILGAVGLALALYLYKRNQSSKGVM